jgi:hypothetical protein
MARDREWLQQHGVDDTEDRRIRADPDRHDADTEQGEARASAQYSQRVTEILTEGIDERDAARLPAVVFRTVDRPELHPGAPFRFAPRRAGGHEILNAHVEVSAHLVRHGVLEPVSTKQGVREGTKPM